MNSIIVTKQQNSGSGNVPDSSLSIPCQTWKHTRSGLSVFTTRLNTSKPFFTVARSPLTFQDSTVKLFPPPPLPSLVGVVPPAVANRWIGKGTRWRISLSVKISKTFFFCFFLLPLPTSPSTSSWVFAREPSPSDASWLPPPPVMLVLVVVLIVVLSFSRDCLVFVSLTSGTPVFFAIIVFAFFCFAMPSLSLSRCCYVFCIHWCLQLPRLGFF